MDCGKPCGHTHILCIYLDILFCHGSFLYRLLSISAAMLCIPSALLFIIFFMAYFHTHHSCWSYICLSLSLSLSLPPWYVLLYHYIFLVFIPLPFPGFLDSCFTCSYTF